MWRENQKASDPRQAALYGSLPMDLYFVTDKAITVRPAQQQNPVNMKRNLSLGRSKKRGPT
jgi:hypothetical protein